MPHAPRSTPRRQLLQRAAALAAASGLAPIGPLARSAWAQGGGAAWPARPVRLIVPAGAGSAPDVVARLLAERLGAAWQQAVVVDNKPGAGGIPGMSALARSPGDGYTLGFVPAAMGTLTPLVYKQPQFNPDTDLRSVAMVGTSPLMIVTQAGNGINSLKDLIARAKARPGALNLAAPQMNSLPHLALERVCRLADVRLLTVPFANAPAAVTSVIAGETLVTADGLPALLQHVQGGRLKALAVTSAQRLPGLDVPTVAETLPGYEMVGWFQIMAPAAAPQPVVDRVHADMLKVSAAVDYANRLREIGIFTRPDSQAAARSFFTEQQQLMKQLAAELNITAQ